MPSDQASALKAWFLENKRSFPWRETLDPYAIWISEVMLQQTRASVVVSYFQKWMYNFPTVHSLAEASLEAIFKVWEGLGYYSRARNLKEGAIEIVKGGGFLPNTLEGLLKIKGIGPYTAGAILSFAFHQKSAAVDGNVVRVISRFKGIEGDLSTTKAKKTVEYETLAFLPENDSWVVMEALIELGATICLPKPKCDKCPLSSKCFARMEQKVDQIPYKKKRVKPIALEKQVAVILWGEEVLVEMKKEGQVLGGLLEFPSFSYDLAKEVEEIVEENFSLRVIKKQILPLEKQSFTIYQIDLYPFILEVAEKKEVEGYFWKRLSILERDYTFSSGHKRILKRLSGLLQNCL